MWIFCHVVSSHVCSLVIVDWEKYFVWWFQWSLLVSQITTPSRKLIKSEKIGSNPKSVSFFWAIVMVWFGMLFSVAFISYVKTMFKKPLINLTFYRFFCGFGIWILNLSGARINTEIVYGLRKTLFQTYCGFRIGLKMSGLKAWKTK